MHQIFVSYSRADSEIMKRICEYLAQLELTIWTDINLIPGTASWSKAIEKALDSSKGLIVLLSPDAKVSEWVDKEINYAYSIIKIPIFPILVRGDERASVPFILAHRQYVDVRNQFEDPLASLAEAIKETIVRDAEQPLQNEISTQPILLPTPASSQIMSLENNYFETNKASRVVSSLKEIIKRISKNTEYEFNQAKLYPVYGIQGVVGYSEKYEYDGEYLLIQNAGANLISSTNPLVTKVEGKFSTKPHLFVVGIQDSKKVLIDYLRLYLLMADLRQLVVGFSAPKLSWQALGRIQVALPPIEEQVHVVATNKEYQDIFEIHRRSLERELEALNRLDGAVKIDIMNGGNQLA